MSEGFTADWLALREPYDHRARAPGPLAHLRTWAQGRAALRILDIGAGTGSTFRALAHLLPAEQTWQAIDGDADLLERLAFHHPIGTLEMDLVEGIDRLPLNSADLLTASALFDLVSREWLERLARRCAHAGLAVYAALTVTPVLIWHPAHELDELIIGAFQRHQRSDKGFGPALGAEAARVQAELFAACGFRIVTGASPWRLGAADRTLMAALADGQAAAAAEAAPGRAASIRDWLDTRRLQVAAREASLIIGHVDMLALPAS